MNRSQALFFAVVGTLLLASIGLAISYRNVWLTLLCSLVSILFIGIGFMFKAKARKKRG
ncbi:DUF5325 family protein [Paenibacillus sp. MBLB4367]|uniref:DUF5325 family protein n=1 Tax=Paenibacillus sp. MBLB4367 TaxID=3384767 RepID=UPI0039080C77